MNAEEIESVKQGDVIIIENKHYEVITLEQDAHRVTEKEYTTVLNIGLHCENSLSISPTEHLLWYYEKKLLLFQKRDTNIRITPEDVVLERKST